LDFLDDVDLPRVFLNGGGGGVANASHLAVSLGPNTAALDVKEQVDRLIRQASANENLCLSFLGWCPFW
jgi:hypothetical protein